MRENCLRSGNDSSELGLRSRGSEVQILSGTPPQPINLPSEISKIRDDLAKSFSATNYDKLREITAVDGGKMGETSDDPDPSDICEFVSYFPP